MEQGAGQESDFAITASVQVEAGQLLLGTCSRRDSCIVVWLTLKSLPILRLYDPRTVQVHIGRTRVEIVMP